MYYILHLKFVSFRSKGIIKNNYLLIPIFEIKFLFFLKDISFPLNVNFIGLNLILFLNHYCL